MPSSTPITAGLPSPLGPTVQKGGVNFAVFSAHASAVYLCLFSRDGKTQTDQIALPARSGNIWHGFVKGLKAGQLYGLRADGPYAPHDGHRFNIHKLLIDPYAKNLFGDFIEHDAIYGYDVHSPEKDLSFSTLDSAAYVPKSIVGEPQFNWGKDAAPNTAWSETIIYEAHVKGLTQQRSDIAPAARGTLTALSDPNIIAYLTELGVSAIELLPLQSFFTEPRLTKMGLTNYWGYNPINYFAPHNPYLGPNGQDAIQTAVKALHKAGIEVILDVVYNHTGESWELGPTLSYRGLDNKSYYSLQDDKRYYVNHTGTGNTLDMSCPTVLDLTIESLRYWVKTLHFDGFRFDLAPTLARDPHDFNAAAPFLEAVKADPILSKVKLIAEPWDIGPGGYVLGQFPKGWAEWNDRYRDDVRSFWRGDHHAHQAAAGRLLGSADIFDHHERNSFSSVNLITAHDGFNLHDTVSYNEKHNHANGEDNRDGHGHNLSDNMGAEGPTHDPHIIAARRQRKKNMLATLLLSQGTPMILAGDEFGHSQQGNNNAYCQDSEISWLNWAEKDDELFAFTRALITLRKDYPHFTQGEFLHGETMPSSSAPNTDWIRPDGQTLHPGDWENAELSCFGLALSMAEQETLIVVFNRGKACAFNFGHHTARLILSSGDTKDDAPNIPAHSVSVFKISGPYLSQGRFDARVNELAHEHGIIESFRDITGHTHHAPIETKLKLLKAMDVDITALTPDLAEPKNSQNYTPVFGAQTLRSAGGVWGVTAALYGLRSARNWGMGDFEDLAVLCETLAGQGADFLGINPVHALFPSAPHLYSPYSPSSRRYLNVMFIAPDKCEDMPADFKVDLSALQAPEHIDYAAVYAAKRRAFEACYSEFTALPKTHMRRKAFAQFTHDEGEALAHHALFEALFETLPKAKQRYDGWKNFPKKYSAPTTKASRTFAKDNSARIEFYAYLQWLAHEQLSTAQSRAKAAGMSIGVYLDFAVGVVPGGSESWAQQEVFAKGVSLGAPGDAANPDGQMWNLLPFNPQKLAVHNYEPYRSALARAMSLGGAVRIDHILGHLRSFWIADDGQGGYVRYPFDGLMEMIAEESHGHDCLIFGEDLGTVPDDFRARMKAYDLMGCNVALIERDSHGQITPREQMRALSITAFSNHDFPTVTGFWEGEDFAWREALGIGDNPETLRWEKERREADKSEFLRRINWPDNSEQPMSAKLMAQLQEWLAASPALAFAVQLDDILLEKHQANVPGTTDEQPNWRRRAKLSLEELAIDPDAAMILNAINRARKGE